MSDNPIHAALDLLQEAVFILDTDRIVKFANRIAIDLFGDRFVGNDFVQVIRHPECIRIIDEVRRDKPVLKYRLH